MSRKKTSAIWLVSDQEFLNLMQSSESVTEVLDKLGYKSKTGKTHRDIQERALALGFNMQEFKTRTERIRREKFSQLGAGARVSNAEIFVENSTYNRSHLRQRIIKERLLPYSCVWCGITDFYNGKPISLQLDHTNGVRDDNRLSNLRWLCPNCHSQTTTHGGKRFKKASRPCHSCGKPLCRGKHALCKSCDNSSRSTTEYPSDSELAVLVFTRPITEIAASLGVSDVAVAKHCKIRGIATPGRGYWAKQRSRKHLYENHKKIGAYSTSLG